MKPILKSIALMLTLCGTVTLTTGANANLETEAFSNAHAENEQEKICHIENSTSASKNCNEGDIMLFIPRRISSSTTKESIILASLVCNFRYEVMHSSDALSCVFTTKRRNQWKRFGME